MRMTCGLGILVLTLGAIPAAGQEAARYAVFNFQAAEGARAEDAALLADRYGLALEARRVDALSRAQVNRALLERQFQGETYGTFAKAAMVAADILQVRYLILGKVGRSGNGCVLETTLIDGQTGAVVRRATAEKAGTPDEAAQSLVEGNAAELLGLPSVGGLAGAAEPGIRSETTPHIGAIDWKTVGRNTLNALEDRVEVGMRLTYFALTNPRKSSGFVGTIHEMTAQEDYSLVSGDRLFWLPNWFMAVKFDRYWGAEILWSEIRTIAENSWNGDNDGTFVLKGPTFGVFGRYPNDTGWTPYAGLGAVFYDGSFHPAGWWANGYTCEADYESLGPEPRNGKTRRMYVDDPIGLVLYAGADVRLWKQLYADLIVRYTWVSTDVSFAGYQNGHTLYVNGPYSVPFDHYAVGAGLKWVF